MRYTQYTKPQVRRMLQTIGVASVDDLFSAVRATLPDPGPLDLPAGMSELDLLRDTTDLARRNHACDELVCFLGGGAYDHFIPSVVDALAGQPAFVTAYTPYQAEASQGILQLFFEFQTMVCALTGMDIANASLYEGASAAAEGVMMAVDITGRRRALVARNVHPDTADVLRAYARQRGVDIATVPDVDGVVDERALADALDGGVAAVLLQSPNFLGCIERLDRLIPAIRAQGALAIVSTDPLAGGVLKTPGALGADVVVAEGQPLGIPMQYGGPYLGLLASREPYLRRLPGRIVGMTTDREGRRAFCLTLQTREQHIRRERATSNVCTNQGLLAIRAAVYVAAMGTTGLTRVAAQCFDNAHYAADAIAAVTGYALPLSAPFFKEFVVRTTRGVDNVLAACRAEGILGGIPLARFDDRLDDCFLVAVTEKRTKADIDRLVSVLAGV